MAANPKPLTRAARREATVQDLVAAAGRLFVERGFHATSVDQVAAAAGYTKGAVYSNFSSKEDLFFAVYERRVQEVVAHVREVLAELGPEQGLHQLAADTTSRSGRDDQWLAVFFEFWAHVVRHDELRERFAATRRAFRAAVEEGLREVVGDGERFGLPVEQVVIAMTALQQALALEHLTDPGATPADLGRRISERTIEAVVGAARDEEDER